MIYIYDSRKLNNIIANNSVELIITSPPYFNLKDYGGEKLQIGFGQDYTSYLKSLEDVFAKCFDILKPERKMCVNIGDITFPKNTIHKVYPLGSDIIQILCNIGFAYHGDIIWQKINNEMSSGGSTNIMGSYPYPFNGVVKLNYEHIIIVSKPGKSKLIYDKYKSKLTKQEWIEYFGSIWNIPGDKQNDHPAKFPIEIPKRLIKMFSFVGDTVLDPFLGSGTTSIAAKMLDRNSIGIELHGGYKEVIRRKIHDSALSKLLTPCEVNFHVI